MASHRDRPAPARPVAMTGSDQQIATGATIVFGIGMSDDGTGTVHAHIYDGTDNTGTLICGVTPPNGGHSNLWFGPNGIDCPNGVRLEMVSGTASGAVYIAQ